MILTAELPGEQPAGQNRGRDFRHAQGRDCRRTTWSARHRWPGAGQPLARRTAAVCALLQTRA